MSTTAVPEWRKQPDRTRKSTYVRPARRLLPALCATLLLVCSPGGAADAAYAAPQRRVDIGHGRKMNLYCIGRGTPTVVFDSGLSDWGFTWALVHPRIATMTRSCVYDRAGLGYSDASHRAGASPNMVDDLHRLLKAADIAPPYVLVGHSLGGLNARLYAAVFPDEISGMVLVDPAHEDGIARIDAQTQGRETRRYAEEVKRTSACARAGAAMKAAAFRKRCIEPADRRYSTELNAARERVERQQSYQKAQLSEIENYLSGASFAAMRAARRSYGDMPLIVLTAEKTITSAGPEWLRMHRELAGLSRGGVQCTIAGVGHYVQLDRPEVVIKAIGGLLSGTRPTASYCSALNATTQ